MRWRCLACNTITEQDDLLHAPSPFDPDIVLTACPECRAVWDETGEDLCDEPNCDRPTVCGWPTPEGGYRRTCNRHANWGTP
jgi:hypothetical protein